MKNLNKILINLVLAILIFSGISAQAQTPTYSCVATNDTLLDTNTYRFDVYIYQTGTIDFYLNNYQLSFLITNTAGILNGGTLTASYVTGTTQLPSGFIPTGAVIMGLGSNKIFRVNGPFPPSSGVLVPTTGLKIGTFEMVNNKPYGHSPLGMTWMNTTPGNTSVRAWISGSSVSITDMTFHTTSFVDPILNLPDTIFSMTGGGNYCVGGGASVGLSDSELGVLYRLVTNGTPTGSWIPGTGGPLSFGSLTAGAYGCVAYRDNTYILATMSGSVTCVIGSVTPVITGNSSICAGTQGLVYSTASGKTNYQWSITGGTIVSGSTTNTVTVNWGLTPPASISVTYKDGTCTSLQGTLSISFSGASSTTPTSITASSNPICINSSTTLTQSGGSLGSGASWKWYTSGCGTTLVGTGASIVVSPTSITTYYVRAEGPCNTSSCASLQVVTFPNVTAGISISQTPVGAICAGTSVTFNSSISNGGSSPAYQWIINSSNVSGATNASFTTTTLSNGNSVKCVLTSSALCVTNSPLTSNAINMVVNQSLPASVAISANPSGTICPSSNVIFTASPTNGGSAPTYQWILNSSNVGTGSTYTNSSWTNGDVVKCVMTSNASCVTGSPASSSMTMVVNPTVNASVVIASNPPSPVCAGASVTFTATPTNGGTSPSYQWKLNSGNIGSGGSTFTTSSLANNDKVSCEMTSNDPCVTISTVPSNTLTMAVNVSVPVSVTITANPLGAICAGSTVTYTATGTNTGSSPTYVWQVSGVTAGTNSSVFASNAFANGNVVTCILTSSLACTTNSPATSLGITMTVNPKPTVYLGHDTILCHDQYIILDAGGGFSQYHWSNGNQTEFIQLDTSVIHGLGSITSYVTVTNVSGCTASDTMKVTFVSCVGVIEYPNNVIIRCYPNPSNGVINIAIEGLAQNSVELSVMNVYSQMIYNEKITNVAANLTKPIDLGIYPKGIYYLRLVAGNKVYGSKIIID